MVGCSSTCDRVRARVGQIIWRDARLCVLLHVAVGDPLVTFRPITLLPSIGW